MEALSMIFTVVCAGFVLLRILCVLDNMSPRTRWPIQWVYALESGGVVAVAAQSLSGDAPSWSTMILLAGVTLSHLVDSRIFPPRLLRKIHRGRRHDDAELAGKR